MIVAGSRMTMNRHGWLFRLLPDQRATSVSASSSASVGGSGVNSRTWRVRSERPDALEGRPAAHDGSGAWRDSTSVAGALWTAGIVPSRPAW